MIIKAIGKGVWRDRPHTFTTWYEPFAERQEIQAAVNFALSQDVTGLCTPGDLNLLPLFLQACENFRPLSEKEQERLIATANAYESVFATGGP